MAERSTSAGSRRTTPQLDPNTEAGPRSFSPPKPTKRATRSQSRDLSDSDGVRATAGEKRRAKQASESKGENRSTKKGRPPKPSKAQPDLPTVTEDPSLAYSQLENEVEGRTEGGGEIGGAVLNSKSPGGASAFSGTTARTSRTAQELEDLEVEGFLDALPDLFSASEKLLKYLLPSKISEVNVDEVREQLGVKNSRAQKNHLRLSDAFQVHRQVFGNGPLIDIRRILRALVGLRDLSSMSVTQWRPDPLLQKANLTLLILNVLNHPATAEVEVFWEELNQSFPQNFLEDQGDLEASTLQQTLQLALEIRTQYAIMLIGRHVGQQTFDIDVILRQVFNEPSSSIRGWAFENMHTEDLPKFFQKAVLQRQLRMRQIYQQAIENNSDDAEVLTSLSTAFPWARFSFEIVSWASDRLRYVQNRITVRGGVEAIVGSLSAEVQHRREILPSQHENDGDRAESPEVPLTFSLPPEMPPTTSEHTSSRKVKNIKQGLNIGLFNSDSPKSKAQATHLKQKAAEREATKARQHAEAQQADQEVPQVQTALIAAASTRLLTPQRKTKGLIPSSAPAKMANEAEPQDREHVWRPADDDGPEHDSDASAFQDQHVQHIPRRSQFLGLRPQMESNKENAAQLSASQSPGANRLHMTDRQPNARRLAFDDSQDSTTNGQHSQMDELSQDAGFQPTHRPADLPPSSADRSPSKRPASEARIIEASPAKRTRFQASPRRSQDRPDSTSRALQERAPQSSQTHAYNEVNRTARIVVACQPKRTQTRKPWSEQEIDTLLELIREHGTGYAKLKELDGPDGILEARDQVGLKDKARNMKMTYLIGGRFLPNNFEKIPLSRLQIEKLESVNIEYNKITGHRVDGVFENEED